MAAFDPLGSSQVTVDPTLLSTPRQVQRDSRQSALLRELLAQGYSLEEAEKLAARQTIQEDWAEQSAQYDAANPGWREAEKASVPTAYREQNAPQADMSDIDSILGRQMTPSGYIQVREFGGAPAPAPSYGRGVPGPRTLDGQPVSPGREFADENAAAAYDDRPVDPETGRLKPSLKDEDYLARGLAARFLPDGTVGYAVAAPAAEGIPGAPGRPGYRADLEDAGYVATGVLGPTGVQQAYVPARNYKRVPGGYAANAPSAKPLEAGAGDRIDDYQRERALYRAAKAAGVSVQAMREADPSKWGGVGVMREGSATRDMIASKRNDDAMAREQSWRSQMMLAGRDPRKNIVNALGEMTPEQRQQSLRYMLPGGQLAAMVDAQNMANSADVIKRYMTSGAVGMQNSPAAQAAAEAAAAAAQQQLPLENREELERRKNRGALPSTSAAGSERLKLIEDSIIGDFATGVEIDAAVELAVKYGIPKQEAEDYFARRRRSWSEWMGFGPEPALPPAGGGGSPYNPSSPYGV